MALKHEVKDADVHFVVDADSRKIIKQTSAKVNLMQYDHNSEEFTFDVPLEIENHDMSQCDLIQVHYENTSAGTSVSTRKTYRGVRDIDPTKLVINEEKKIVSFGWLVPETATTFAGTLKFQLKFICYDKEDGTIPGYKWHTDVNDDIGIKAGLGYSESDFDPTTTATLQSIEIEEIDNGLRITLDGVAYELYNGSGGGGSVPDNVETTDNKVTTITANATDTQYPSAKAVRALFNSIAGSSVPTIASGDTGKILQVENGTYVLKPVSTSSVATYFSTKVAETTVMTIDDKSTDIQHPTAKAVYKLINDHEKRVDASKVTSIDLNSTDDQHPTAKAVYNLFNTYKESVNTSIVNALNTDVEV